MFRRMRVLPLIGFAVSLAGIGCASPRHPREPSLLPAGARVPDLEGVDQEGVTHRLRDDRGKPIVVYFYPKDGTPGCTKEACAYRDAWNRYEEAGVVVFGVSSDTLASHQRFASKHDLTFPLIADSDGRWAGAFGVKATGGLYQRVTFLIGRDGTVAKVYPSVDPGLNALEVLEDATTL